MSDPKDDHLMKQSYEVMGLDRHFSDDLFDRLIEKPALFPQTRVPQKDLFGQLEELDALDYSDVPNGFFTLSDSHGHTTFRIRTQKESAKFAPGKRIVGFLSGPENTSNYTNIGFLEPHALVIWKRWLGSRQAKLAQELIKALKGEEVPFSLQESRHCIRCNRLLTTPESIERGIGPECLAKYGG